MMNLRKTAEEINRLRQLVDNQKDTIKKSMLVINQLLEENQKLQAAITGDDIIFPNTDPRGLSDPSNSEPEGLDNIY